jgi:hypothetical protein
MTLRARVELIVTLAAAVGALHCTSSADQPDGAAPTPCVVGRSLACVGPASCSGYQVCNADGKSFAPCQCGTPPDATAGDGSMDGPNSADSIADAVASEAQNPQDATVSDANGAQDGSARDAGRDVGPRNPPPVCGDASSVCACPPTCPDGTFLFGKACVPVDDPEFGCGTGTPCNVPNAYPTCRGGACAMTACMPGFADCDGNPANGCEADLSSTSTCTACNIACATGEQCLSTGCASTCAPPNTDCAGTCRDLQTDRNACGSCNVSCGNGTCSNGACTCSPGAMTCAGGGCGGNTSQNCNCYVCKGPATKFGQVDLGLCAANASPVPLFYPCAHACAPPYTRCPGAPDAMWGPFDCSDTWSDPKNCGACGIACATTEVCLVGNCQPRSVLQWIAGLITPTHIAQDANNIYWTDPGDDTINAASKSTGQRTVLAHATSGWMAVDDTDVYWMGAAEAGTGALRVPKIGGAVTQVTGSTSADEIGVDATTLVWRASQSFYSVPKSGGSPTLIATVQGAQDFAPPYFTVDSGGTPTTKGLWHLGNGGAVPPDPLFAATPGESAISTDANGFYYLHYIYRPSPSVSEWRIEGSSVWVLGGDVYGLVVPPRAHTITSDGCSGVVWTTGGPDIWRVSAGAAPVRVVGGGNKTMEPVVDNTYVYWTDAGGWIGRIAKY